MPPMKNEKRMISLAPETWRTLDRYAEQSGLKTANALLSAAGFELAQASKKGLNVYHVLGRIAASEPGEERKTLMPMRSAPAPAISR